MDERNKRKPKVNNIITLKGIDVLGGTPLLDIKPYIPQFNAISSVKIGWMKKNDAEVTEVSFDSRFI